MEHKKNPYHALLELGVPIDNHESDLYAEATPEALAIVKASGWSWSTFTNQITGTLWIDVPFAFEPFWAAKGVQS